MAADAVTPTAGAVDETDAHAEAIAHAEHDPAQLHERPHPKPSTYVLVAFILAIVTAAEIGMSYTESVSDMTISLSLLAMMVVKFFMVALWFMHLRFDRPIFRRFFIGGIILALAAYAVALSAMGVFPLFIGD